jgi:hypothetical protein
LKPHGVVIEIGAGQQLASLRQRRLGSGD